MTAIRTDTPPVSIHDFTITVDTQESGGDKLVVRLDRAGQPTLHMACSATQLLWVIDDPDYFTNAYKFTIFKRVADLREQGRTFGEIGRELSIEPAWAQQVYDDTTAAAQARGDA
jgi:hypothetical protein